MRIKPRFYIVKHRCNAHIEIPMWERKGEGTDRTRRQRGEKKAETVSEGKRHQSQVWWRKWVKTKYSDADVLKCHNGPGRWLSRQMCLL